MNRNTQLVGFGGRRVLAAGGALAGTYLDRAVQEQGAWPTTYTFTGLTMKDGLIAVLAIGTQPHWSWGGYLDEGGGNEETLTQVYGDTSSPGSNGGILTATWGGGDVTADVKVTFNGGEDKLAIAIFHVANGTFEGGALDATAYNGITDATITDAAFIAGCVLSSQGSIANLNGATEASGTVDSASWRSHAVSKSSDTLDLDWTGFPADFLISGGWS